jgi:hypothetical protein
LLAGLPFSDPQIWSGAWKFAYLNKFPGDAAAADQRTTRLIKLIPRAFSCHKLSSGALLLFSLFITSALTSCS